LRDLNEATIDGIIAFAGSHPFDVISYPVGVKKSGRKTKTIYSAPCKLLITGGTEPGHNSETLSHTKGYKVDIRTTDQIDHYIQSQYVQLESRSADCAEQRMTPKGSVPITNPLAGAIFAREDWSVGYQVR
jgi:hypothetical protein